MGYQEGKNKCQRGNPEQVDDDGEMKARGLIIYVAGIGNFSVEDTGVGAQIQVVDT